MNHCDHLFFLLLFDGEVTKNNCYGCRNLQKSHPIKKYIDGNINFSTYFLSHQTIYMSDEP